LIAAKELGIFRDEGQEFDIVHIPLIQGLESLRDGDFCSGTAQAPLMTFPEWHGVKLVAALKQSTHWMLVMRREFFCLNRFVLTEVT
jgi:hypothetical protein